MDYEKFKQDMEQDVLKNIANRGVKYYRPTLLDTESKKALYYI